MNKQIVLTGITTTGTPHLGNYVGAIRPCIEASKDDSKLSYYFLADYHSLVKCHDPKIVKQSSLEGAATWLAMGLDTDKSVFYRQSDIPEIPELTWILTCMTSKGLMNRAHAYKGAVAENESKGKKDLDKGINMGLFCYPVLMAADILIFKANKVPVGKDQIQHLEMARDIAGVFNSTYKKKIFTLPEAVVDENDSILSGLDGRKMSKSYNNTIPLFVPEKKLRKLIMKIKTNSLEPGEPKDSKECTIFEIFKSFAGETEVQDFQKRYDEGISWGEAKQFLFEYLNNILSGPRAEYEKLIENPDYVEEILLKGALKAREQSSSLLQEVREAVGIMPLTK